MIHLSEFHKLIEAFSYYQDRAFIDVDDLPSSQMAFTVSNIP